MVCPELRRLSVGGRWHLVRTSSRCPNCLGKHELAVCQCQKRCRACGAPHHSLLHVDAPRQQSRLPTLDFPQPRTFGRGRGRASLMQRTVHYLEERRPGQAAPAPLPLVNAGRARLLQRVLSLQQERLIGTQQANAPIRREVMTTLRVAHQARLPILSAHLDSEEETRTVRFVSCPADCTCDVCRAYKP